jgi:hypothetical protein
MFKENSITFLWEQNKLPKTQYLKKKNRNLFSVLKARSPKKPKVKVSAGPWYDYLQRL